jgi:uncharacterized membrane protein YoaK (UPF0700 family)
MQFSHPRPELRLPARGVVLVYSSFLALSAGFVNAVALLIFAMPVGNLTASTTQLGMKTANPWLYEGHVLVAVLTGFFLGAALAGLVLPVADSVLGPRSAGLLCLEAVLLILAGAVSEETGVKALVTAAAIELPAVQAFLAAGALGLQNGLTSSFREMSVRTTHFTGTITDLGLIVGRSRKCGIDGWKTTTLGLTLFLFLMGGGAGLLAGSRFGGYAFGFPALCCLIAAVAAFRHCHQAGLLSRRRCEVAQHDAAISSHIVTQRH